MVETSKIILCIAAGMFIGLFLGALFFSTPGHSRAFKKAKAKIKQVDADIDRANNRLKREGRGAC